MVNKSNIKLVFELNVRLIYCFLMALHLLLNTYSLLLDTHLYFDRSQLRKSFFYTVLNCGG